MSALSISATARDTLLAAIKPDAAGLIPAIAQQHDTGEVLMVAWMNKESLAETLATGRVCYYSRSRKALWRKGETSGQVQMLVDLRLDCDGDTILLLVDQQGVACHTGRRNCFYRAPRGDDRGGFRGGDRDSAPRGPQRESTGERANGTVKFFNDMKGFGFVQRDDGGEDVFVHISALERSGMGQVTQGDRLAFDIEIDRRGKYSATNLSTLSE
jgi:phosphoribosyl-AMP cyclohydrolase